MKVEYKDKECEGGCNFCYTNTYQKVTVITGTGHGPQLSARICDSCLDEIIKFRKKE